MGRGGGIYFTNMKIVMQHLKEESKRIGYKSPAQPILVLQSHFYRRDKAREVRQMCRGGTVSIQGF